MSTDYPDFLSTAYVNGSDDETRALYDRWAETYDLEITDNNYAQPKRCCDALLNLTNGNVSGKIIDIGCGTGLSGIALNQAGFSHIDGCDLSLKMLEKAEKLDVYSKLFEANLNQPPLNISPDYYDAAVIVGVFSFGHVNADCMDEIVRILKPGAPIIIGMNDKFFKEGSLMSKLMQLHRDGDINLHDLHHGEHLSGIGLTGWVISMAKV